MNTIIKNVLILVAVSYLSSIITQGCQEDKKPEIPPSPPITVQSCASQNGHACDILKCTDAGGTPISSSDINAPNVCCNKNCDGLQSTPNNNGRPSTGGISTKTCEIQEGEDCSLKPYCEQDKWISASDTRTCCSTKCLQRIQIPISFSSLQGTVEKIGAGYIIFTKPSSPGAGNVNEISTTPLGMNKYSFTFKNCAYDFKVVETSTTQFSISDTQENCR